jgi:hypothetical protein
MMSADTPEETVKRKKRKRASTGAEGAAPEGGEKIRKRRKRQDAGAAADVAGEAAAKTRGKRRGGKKERGNRDNDGSNMVASLNYLLDGLAGEHFDQIEGKEKFLPNAIIIGAAKSGTTTLIDALGKHPDIFRSSPKEPKFLSMEYGKGWAWYLRLFREGADKKIRMEASTRYSSGQGSHRFAPLLMKTYMPEVKLIHMSRQPMDRVVSHWRHVKGRDENGRHGDFNSMLEEKSLTGLVVGSSMYWARLSEYRRHFPDAQILCLTMEDMISDAPGTLKKVLEFLGLPATQEAMDTILVNGQFEQQNEAGAKGRIYFDKPEWSPEIYAKVKAMIEPDMKKYLAYIGKPEDYWKI